jgi:hypothetical protein
MKRHRSNNSDQGKRNKKMVEFKTNLVKLVTPCLERGAGRFSGSHLNVSTQQAAGSFREGTP